MSRKLFLSYDNSFYSCPTVWQNFVGTLYDNWAKDPLAIDWSNHLMNCLSEDYTASFDEDGHHLNFESEAGYMLFILRWS